MTDKLDELIQQREAEARAEEVRNQEEAREQRRLAHARNTTIQQFELTAATWLAVIAGQFAGKMQMAAQITAQSTGTGTCCIFYEKKGGALAKSAAATPGRARIFCSTEL